MVVIGIDYGMFNLEVVFFDGNYYFYVKFDFQVKDGNKICLLIFIYYLDELFMLLDEIVEVKVVQLQCIIGE